MKRGTNFVLKSIQHALWHRAEEEQIDGGGREERETDENGRSGLFLKVLCFSNTHLYFKPHLVCVIKALTAPHQLTLSRHMGSDALIRFQQKKEKSWVATTAAKLTRRKVALHQEEKKNVVLSWKSWPPQLSYLLSVFRACLLSHW